MYSDVAREAVACTALAPAHVQLRHRQVSLSAVTRAAAAVTRASTVLAAAAVAQTVVPCALLARAAVARSTFV